MVKLDILSDPICPWCLIGKTYLDRALADFPDHPFEIEWHPFQLNPDMMPEGADRTAYLEAKFGGSEGAERVYGGIKKTAQEADINIDFDAIQRTPNTLNAHRLIHWAGLEGRQTAMVSALFKAYFQDGQDIGDEAVLLDLAEGVEMDRAMVERLLATDSDMDDIRKRDSHARERGVSGVPTFVVAGQHVLRGAQPAETWVEVVKDIQQQLAAHNND